MVSMRHFATDVRPFILMLSSTLLVCVCAGTVNSSETLFNATDRYTRKKWKSSHGTKTYQIGLAELPGYTGWNRHRFNSKVDHCFTTAIGKQAVTLDGYLNIFHFDVADSSNEWSLSIACPNVTSTVDERHLAGPLFYARAYGPAVLVGTQKHSHVMTLYNQQYYVTDISFAFKDAGLYTVEVVLESIFTPNVYSLPRTPQLEYSGFILRGFPWFLNVTISRTAESMCSNSTSCNITFCTSMDIESDFSTFSGRWIYLGYTKRIRNKLIVDIPSMRDPSLQNNVQGSNRLSIEMEYKPINCYLTPLMRLISSMDTCGGDTGIHFIFMGDSVTRQHHGALDNLLNSPNQVTMIDLAAMSIRLESASEALREIQQENSTQPKVFIFNAAIWEIAFYCTQSTLRVKHNISDDDIGNCADHYRVQFKQLLDLVSLTFPTELKIFRTTNAAWMRWGNFGFAWGARDIRHVSNDVAHKQMMVQSPHTVKMFNDIALQVIRESGYDVKIYDTFWMTWSRPDDTEINSNNDVGNHMVHLGHDTLKASLRKLITIILDYFGCRQ